MTNVRSSNVWRKLTLARGPRVVKGVKVRITAHARYDRTDSMHGACAENHRLVSGVWHSTLSEAGRAAFLGSTRSMDLDR